MRPTESIVERIGNVLAGSLALYWIVRGVLILSGTISNVAFEDMVASGRTFDLLAMMLPAISIIFLGLGLAVVLRPADPKIALLQLFVIGILTAWGTIGDPSLWTGAFAPLAKNIVVVGVILFLIRLARADVALFSLERDLRLWLGGVWFVTGLINVVAPSAGAFEAVPISLDPAVVVRLLGGVEALVGLLVMMVPAHTPLVRTGLLLQAAALCLVPAMASVDAGSYLYHPFAPQLKNLPTLGAVVACLYMGRLREVRFVGRLRLAQMYSRLAASMRRRLVAPGGVSGGEMGDTEAVDGLLRDHIPTRVEPLFWGKMVGIAVAVAAVLPRRVAGQVTNMCEEGSARAFERCLKTLSERSLSRRTIEGLVHSHRSRDTRRGLS